jgi:hypothetical protein
MAETELTPGGNRREKLKRAFRHLLAVSPGDLPHDDLKARFQSLRKLVIPDGMTYPSSIDALPETDIEQAAADSQTFSRRLRSAIVCRIQIPRAVAFNP